MEKVLTFGLMLCIVMLSGCSDCSSNSNNDTTSIPDQATRNYADRKNKVDYISNARAMSDGYVMYEIENDTVTCRESRSRAEIACWKNGREPMIVPQERTSF